MNVPRLLVVTDRGQLPAGRTLEETVRACAAAGAAWFWVREHDLPGPVRGRLVARLADVPGVTVISGRHWHPGARGVHLRPGAAPAPTPAGPVRPGAALPGPVFHGRSCHDDAEVLRAVAGGAAYVTVSPVAASRSKPGHGPALTPAGVASAVRAAGEVPVLALGGVDETNAGSFVVAGPGAHGVAVMGALMRAEDPGRVVTRLLAEVTP